MIAEIIAAWSEMLTPFRQDTNSLYLKDRRWYSYASSAG
jgi:hypothetical protein